MISNGFPNLLNIPYVFPSLSQTCSTLNNLNSNSYTGYNINSDQRNNSLATLRLKAREHSVTFNGL